MATATSAVVQRVQSRSFQPRLRQHHRLVPTRLAQRPWVGSREFPLNRVTGSGVPVHSRAVPVRSSMATATSEIGRAHV